MGIKKSLVLPGLILIIVVAAFLRFYNLNNNPNGFYVDEVITAVNAWSILQTGKDEYGKNLPLAFRFFGSYTPPLYTYLTSVSMQVFGYSIFATRFLSAFSGTVLILIFFVLLRKLSFVKDNRVILLATLLLSITPWAIFYSRVGYETNLAFVLFSGGCLFLWLSCKKPWFLLPAFGLMSLSTLTYHSEKLLAPLFILTFLLVFRKVILKKQNVKPLILAFVAYFLIAIPQLLIIFTPANTSRGLGLFYDSEILTQAKLMNIPLVVSWPISFSSEFLSQYFSYYSPRNLFFQPDSDLQRSFPELSVFYPWMVILYLIGLVILVNQREKSNARFILLLFLLAPIPAAFTGDPFSTQRSLPLLLPTMLILSVGLQKITSLHKISYILVAFLVFLSLASLYRSMAVLLPNERATIWGYGFEQLAKEISKNPNEKFIIDGSRIKPAYAELAFYLKTPPQEIQKSVDPSIKDNYYFMTRWESFYQIANFETKIIDWKADVYQEQILVGDDLAISDTQAKEHFLTKLFEIKDPIGQVVFKGYRTNPRLKCQNSLSKYCKKMQ